MRRDISVLGIDLAKEVFQIHGADSKGKQVFSKRTNRKGLIALLSNMSPCLVGIEACTGSHYRARVFRGYGHEVKIMAPQLVKPYIPGNKNDANDAYGISEAVCRPQMRFVSIKEQTQQDVLMAHRIRELAVKSRTSEANQIRGLLAEYGVVMSQGISAVHKLPAVLEANKDKLSVQALMMFEESYKQFKLHDERVKMYDKQIETYAKENEACQALLKIEGVGPLTASALVATIGNAKHFKNGRELSAWLGLVPRQYSSGNTQRLGGISKRGDRYLRTLLIHGARCALKYVDKKTDKKSLWALNKKQTMGFNKAAVALANKHVRIIWAMLTSGECYRLQD